jgi:hypothetical protein
MPLILPQCAIRINPFKHDYVAHVEAIQTLAKAGEEVSGSSRL